MNFQPVKIQKVSAQVAEQIITSIQSGEFSPGEKLPAERDLAKIFGVSRPTVRAGLNILANAGFISSYRGGGTVVSSQLSFIPDNFNSQLLCA
jgi:GntR family transcriptional repressor for pyruvate dehydrogenase complex